RHGPRAVRRHRRVQVLETCGITPDDDQVQPLVVLDVEPGDGVFVRPQDPEPELLGAVRAHRRGQRLEGVAVLRRAQTTRQARHVGVLRVPAVAVAPGRRLVRAGGRLVLRACRGTDGPAATHGHGDRGGEHGEFGGGVHANAYPASSTAARTSATFRSDSLTTVTFPVARSTDTSRTPEMAPISSETELAQWPQVMPVTV